MRARVSVLLLIVCLTTMLGAAQERATIVITITDTARAVLPGVTVRLEGPDRRTVISDARGQATFVGILPGKYRITAELAGFTTAQAELTVAAGATERRAIAMSVGAITEGVTVTGQSPTLDSSRGVRVGGNVSGVAGGTAAYHPGGWYEPRWHRDADRNAEKYSDHGENAFRTVSAEPLSTFSIDVDTASYSNVRRFLNEGTLPPEQAVRIEELINYFKFDYPQPKGNDPFSITTEVAESPWNNKHRLVLIGLKGREIAENRTPRRNLVFLIDVSGSMADRDKLPLVQHGLRMLAGTLTANDRVAIVVYAGASGVVLESTPGDRKERIDRAIANLHAGGSTNGGAGITLAYKLARESFITGGVNRVILATDGDFNVGVTDQKELERLIERERESGVFLSVLGVGTGNINDTFMELLADKGNGNYSYLDTMHEAHRVLVKEAGSTFVTIAKDVKIQVEFNPKLVDGYRLIGYENRMLRDQDFNDDRKDAGEIGAGHSVTAIYEIVPAGVGVDRPRVDPLKYSTAPQAAAASSPGRFDNELLTVKLRYKAPDGDVSDLTSASVTNRVSPMSANLGFASAVAEAGMLLRGSQLAKNASYPAAIARARQFRGEDPDGYRAEFARLMELAATLSKRQRTER
jgi:Ca-activated chloride channel family protein